MRKVVVRFSRQRQRRHRRVTVESSSKEKKKEKHSSSSSPQSCSAVQLASIMMIPEDTPASASSHSNTSGSRAIAFLSDSLREKGTMGMKSTACPSSFSLVFFAPSRTLSTDADLASSRV